MRAEDAKKLTTKQLEAKADELFTQAEETNTHIAGGEFEKLRLHLDAQYYLTLAARKHDDKKSLRDRILELVVIALIAWEVLEGSQQAKILERMDASTKLTATTTKSVAEDQKRSSEALGKMNGNLETSAGVLSDQLRILKQAQAERSKKPILSLQVPGGSSPISWRTLEGTIIIRSDTVITGVTRNDILITSDFQLKNSGPITAHGVEVRVTLTSKAVNITARRPTDNLAIRDDTPEPNPALGPYDEPRYYTIVLHDVRPNLPAPLPLAVHFPKNHDAFAIKFDVSSEEISSPVNLLNVFVDVQQQP